MNCTTYSCDGVNGGWRRIVYLNVNNSTVSTCPSELEEESNPLSCRISYNYDHGNCSSIKYYIY